MGSGWLCVMRPGQFETAQFYQANKRWRRSFWSRAHFGARLASLTAEPYDLIHDHHHV
jgi:hypothetical protein